MKLELSNSIFVIETNEKLQFSDVGFETFWIEIERNGKAPYFLFSKCLTIVSN